MFKIFKKKDMISDGGVKQHGNHVDVFIILGCIILSSILLYLAIMAYYTAYA